MRDTIIIEVETVNTCFGIMARFWDKDAQIEQVGLKQVLNAMNEITARYNNMLNKAVMFTTK
mgnify:CR=1 FL=1